MYSNFNKYLISIARKSRLGITVSFFSRVIGAIFFVIVGGLIPCSAVAAETFDIISKLVDTPAATVWRIELPNVKQKETRYPQIVFVKGDKVSVDAGGCVQTGGKGLTWKRYVDPSGDNSNRLYHGLIAIPGVTNGLVRLLNFGLNSIHSLSATSTPGGVSGSSSLSLGYEDDGYSDNGYTAHDDGTGGQCTSGVNAFVVVSIGHAGNAPIPPQRARRHHARQISLPSGMGIQKFRHVPTQLEFFSKCIPV